MGHTTNPDIRIAKSVVDYIFRWLGNAFLPGFLEASRGLPPTPEDETNLDADAGNMLAVSDRTRRPSGRRGRGQRQVDQGVLEQRAYARRPPQRQLPIDAQPAVRRFPERRTHVRQLRSHHRPQRQLLPVPQLWQQHGVS